MADCFLGTSLLSFSGEKATSENLISMESNLLPALLLPSNAIKLSMKPTTIGIPSVRISALHVSNIFYYIITCIQRPLTGSNESGLLQQVVIECRFY